MDSIKLGLRTFLLSQSAITDIVGQRIYHREVPQNPTYPLLVFHLITDVPLSHTHDGLVGPWRARFQIDGYAASVPVVEDLMLQLSNALAAYTGTMGSFTVGGVFDYGLMEDKSFRDEVSLKFIEGRANDYVITYHRIDSSPI